MQTDTQEPARHILQLARKAKRAIRRKNLDALGAALGLPERDPANDRIRILGPYRNRTKWRIVFVEGKERKSVCAPSYEEALTLLAKCKQEVERTQTKTIGNSLQDYREYLLRVRHIRPAPQTTSTRR